LYDLPAKSGVKIYATCGTRKEAQIEVSRVKKLERAGSANLNRAISGVSA
jgi:hypothetical protein